ncbi:ORF6C domain-containing protein [Tepidibacter thalassicus]|uniref:Prophage antirepressor n=1 Tax=Tepidibacter thalassicus DSM 15285 TaxID=1123350 RepID=A0A1M5PXW0_9FIRM|nr:ORF6C domain-containing protein [Tepidibacter thalassicus]SHH06299.1 Prophage antirepressor [Tepidibacter thalassicus DSM 15285]
MKNFKIVRSENFGTVKCDFYQGSNDEIFMTAEQLGQALDYSNPRVSIGNLVNRNEHLKNSEFSSVINLVTEAGIRETRVFNEDGIYEVTMLAKTEKAKEFRSWVRKILKSLRRRQAILVPTNNSLEALKLMNQQIGLLIESQQELNQKIENVDKKVETQITLTYNQAKEIQFAVKCRIIELLGGKETEAYKIYKNKYFQAIHRDIKKRLGVPSYRDILKKDYAMAFNFIKNWIPEVNVRIGA